MNVVVDRVRKSYGRGAEAREVLTETSLTVRSQEFVSIVGPSGCGKSTLLMMMAGLLKPSSGEIRLGDEPVTGPPAGLSVVFQDYSRSLFPWMSVRRNLTTALTASRLGKEEQRSRVEHALESVGLAGKGEMYPWQMSGGMQQRVAIARALVTEPTVMLMDEPFAAVDAQTRADLEDLVLRVRHEYDVTVAFVTHDIDESVYMADRIVVLAANPGRIAADLTVDLPRPRDQVETKLDARFAKLRSEVFRLVMRPDTPASA
ncbi:ABC transporter ATP-binding protein [Nocardioides carbamazepini]|jgi:NitT/TauT family transport system ATP-binding protein|uniref:ABC transporter ATP-binding protein n=1 Tax=Nocardioides carbamazepini TaxID=2854259 RepID=UPI00214A878F|nr:ABC transporter ATP-binding protein [Nocardioides carbamazepini]MCR1784623.1 ABC transporter ATP-binding protein [Nocardioides carbamazepini]